MKSTLKFFIILLIGAAIQAPAICQSTDEYKPPTPEEIMGYWSGLTPEQRIQEIIKLDLIEHSTPKISGLQTAAVLMKDGALVIWFLNPIDIKIGSLEYKVEFPAETIEGFSPPVKTFWPYLITPMITAGLAMGGVAMGGSGESWKYVLSGVIGLAFGIGLDIFWTQPG